MTTQPIKITLPIAQDFLDQNRAAFAIIHDVSNFLLPLATQNDILEQIEGIFLLDNACQELLEVRLSLFLNGAHKPRLLLNTEEQQLLKYFSFLANIYYCALKNYLSKMHTQQQPDSKLPLKLIARTLHYRNEEIKWHLFFFKIPSKQIWQKINNTYHLAETLNLAEKAVFIFDQDTKATTAQDLFLIAHMQGALRHGSLNASEIEQAYKILYAHSNQIRIHTTPSVNTTFVATLDSKDPATYYQNGAVTATQRFWSMHTIESTINQWRAAFIAGYPLADLEIKELSHLTMNKLIQAWQPQRTYPTRAERKPVNIETTCIIGFNAIIEKLHIDGNFKKNTPKTTMANIELAIGNQTSYIPESINNQIQPTPIEFPCTILNSGHTGVALTLGLNKKLNLELEIGSLILWYTSSKKNSISNIGIIKRLWHQEKEHLLIGVELICSNPLSTKIRPLQPTNTSPSIKLDVHGLLCQIQQQKKYILLTKPMNHEHNLVWQLTLQNLNFEFKTKAIIKCGPDWCATDIQILDNK